MAKQRGHGEGSIYQRKDKRWVASITLENRKRKYLYGDTRKEVLDKLKVALHEQQQGTLATGPKQTVKQFLEHWLEEVHKSNIRISSYIKYRGLLDNHILPVIGHLQLQKLTPQHVQSLYAHKLKEGFSPVVIHSIHRVLHHALDQAVRWKLLGRNACNDVELPRLMKREIQPLNKEQAQKLLETAQGHRLEGLLTLAIATGMRRGELLSLRWRDVNLPDKSLQVRRTGEHIPGHGFIENEPKTARGRRKVTLPQFVVDALKEHRINQFEARLKAGDVWVDRDLVFCDPKGDFFPARTLTHMFQRLLKEAGLSHIRFHDLRHSAATILLTMGVHPKVVQELLGHSEISMTMDTYSHVLPSMQKEAMDKLEGFFGVDKRGDERTK